MADDSFQERTEPATAKRLRDARDRGQVAKSPEIGTVAVLATALAYLGFAGPGLLAHLEIVARRFLSMSDGRYPVEPTSMQHLFSSIVYDVGTMVLPLALVVGVAGVAANVGQFGFLFTLKPLMPKLSPLNPIAGMKRLFGWQGVVESIKSILKFVIVAGFLYTFIRKLGNGLLALTHCPLREIAGIVGGMVLGIAWRIVAALLLLAIADLVYQRYTYKKNLRMSKQEVKDERKQSEGDERTRARIRAKQMQMTRNRMLAAVPRANVVITNPYHVAVALRYDPHTMPAPEVVAKGARLMAQRIKSIARQHGVPVIERPPIARLIFRTVKVGQSIPASLYQAVAEILAHVYRTRMPRPAATRAAGTMPPAMIGAGAAATDVTTTGLTDPESGIERD